MTKTELGVLIFGLASFVLGLVLGRVRREPSKLDVDSAERKRMFIREGWRGR